MGRIPTTRTLCGAILLGLALVAGAARAQVVYPVTVYDPAAATAGTDDPAATNGTFRDAVVDANGSAGIDTVTFDQVAGGQLDLDSNNGNVVLGEDLDLEVDTTTGTGILVDADGVDFLDGTFNVTIRGDETLTLTDTRIATGASTLTIRESATLALSDPGDPTRDHVGDATAVLIQDTGTLRLDDDLETIGSLAGAGAVVLQRTAQATELSVGGDNTNTTYSGVISGTNGVLRKTGTGTLTLSGANTHSGMTSSTILEQGAIAITNAQALGAGNFEFDGTGNDLLQIGAALTVGNGIAMTTSGIVDTNGFNAQLSGAVTGSGELIKAGTGVLTLSGNNTNDGGIELRAGALVVGSATALGDPAGTFEVNGTGNEVLRFGGAFDVENTVNLVTNLGVDTNGFAGSIPGAITGGALLIKGGAGTLTLSSPDSDYTGGTRIAAGEIAVTDDAALGSGAVTFVAAGTSLDLASNGIVIPNDVFQMSDAIYEVNVAGESGTLGGVVGGVGSLNKNGAGTLILTNQTNGWQGATAINAGVLQLGATEVLPDVTQLTIAGGATFDTNDNGDTVASIAGAGTAEIRSGFLVLAGSDTATFSGVFNGNGTVQRTGTGASIFTGASTGYTGNMLVSGGTLRLDGSTSGFAVSNATGTFEGTGSIGTTLTNFSRVAPGTGGVGTLTVGTDYNQGGAGILVAEVDAGGGSDLLDATGDANLDGTLSLQASAGDQGLTFGRTFTVLEADGTINGTFATIDDNLDFFTPTVTIDNTGATSRVLVSFDQVARDFRTVAANENQAEVARALQESLVAGQAGTDLRGVIGKVLSLPLDEAQTLLQQMAGEVRTAAISATLQSDSIFTGRVMGQLDALRTDPRESSETRDEGQVAGVASPVSGFGIDGWLEGATQGAAPGGKWAGDKDRQLWLLGTGIWGDLDPTATQQGFEYDGAGFVLGYSWKPDKNWLLGVHAGFTGTGVDTVGALDKVNVDSMQGGLHLSWSDNGSYIDGLVGLSGHQYESERFIQVPGIDRKATADYDADEISVYAEMGQIYELGEEGQTEQWHAQPQGAVHYRGYMQDAYTEIGAGDLNLAVRETEADFFQTALGLRMYYTCAIEDGGWIIPDFMVRWGHEFGDVDRAIQSAFVGTDRTFETNGRKAARDTLQLRAGVTAYTLEDLTVHIGYNGDIADGQNNHAAVGRVVWKF